MRPVKLKEPASTRILSTREQIILLEASKLHGCRFPPWKNPPEASEFEQGEDRLLFIDEDAVSRLSETQLAIFDDWKRPDQVLPAGSEQQPEMRPSIDTAMNAIEKVNLVQDVTCDCSVVASLCAEVARAERGHSTHDQILSSIFHPYDHTLQQPIRSKNGKYVFRLYFNGCWRKVTIDDRLPASNGSRALHVLDRNNPSLLWPALVEKAYLKIRGGYDFPGSNSGSDLWILSGWIPEQVGSTSSAIVGKSLRAERTADLGGDSDDVDREALWLRIMKAFNYGDVLLTLGTGKTSELEESVTGLPGEHDYAVIDLEERSGKCFFLIKNPWSEGAGWTSGVRSIVEDDTVDHGDQVSKSVSRKEIGAKQLKTEPGTFWMNIHEVFQQFESLYLNWNPGLFFYREDVHFAWDIARTNGLWASFGNNPQYRVYSKAGGTVWLLLNRHFTSSHQATSDADKNSRTPSATDTGFTSLYAFQNGGDKVYLTDGFIVRAPYVDSPNILLKIEMPATVPYTVVISGQELHRSSHSFTLSAFSLKPLTISEAHDRHQCHTVQTGTWTPTTAGGNASSPNYFKNPQYSIKLPQSSDVSLLLELHSGEFPVHVKLIWSDGKPVRVIGARDIVGDSGEYRKGHAFAQICNVPAGSYTIVCSTFEQGQLGKFTLQIGSMAKCMVQRIFAWPAGLFVSRPKTAFFVGDIDRLWAPLQCPRLARLSVVAQPHDMAGTKDDGVKSNIVPFRLSLEIGHGLMKQVLASSVNDDFSNGYYGTQISDVDIQPSMYPQAGVRLVVERTGPLDPGDQEGVDVEIYSNAKIEIGSWLGYT
ncbi:MAG: hypothetical protein Q9225_001126 [Loekoesia sp. 1 TL-2023]